MTSNRNTEQELELPSFKMRGTAPRADEEHSDMPEELLNALFHDLRSPLGAINVITEIMSKHVEANQTIEPRQFRMLQDAVTKSQRILDDALEFQTIIHGHSTFSFATTELKTLTRNSLDKARHAPYFRNINAEYDDDDGETLVRVDLEKAESGLLCIFEQVSRLFTEPTRLSISHEIQDEFGCIRLSLDDNQFYEEMIALFTNHSMKGKLGIRRLGESRYNLFICSKVITQMGGHLEQLLEEPLPTLLIKLPLADL